MSLDKIEALEERITRVVELVGGLKKEKSRLEDEITTLQTELSAKKAMEEELSRLREEKEEVRARLENILKGIEGLDI